MNLQHSRPLASGNSVAIVTGGAGGLGLVIAQELKRQGFSVAIFDRSSERLAALSSDFVSYEVDVTSVEAVHTSVKQVEQQLGAVHVLVNNAGAIHSEPLINLLAREERRHKLQTLTECLQSNLISTFVATSVVAEAMVEQRVAGVLINISSISASGNAGQTAYAAAKAGVEAMTITWSQELGPFGVRSVAIAPGFIDTPSTHAALGEEQVKELKREIPLRRLGRAEEVAAMVTHVIQNKYINGCVIPVDGGLRL